MADHFYGVAIGRSLDPSKVTVGTSTGSTTIELRTTDGAGLTQLDVLMGLKQLETYFQNHVPTP